MAMIGELIIVLLAIIGLVVACHKIADGILRPHYKGEITMVLPFRGRVEDIEYRLRYVAGQYQKMTQDTEVGWLICLDEGMEEETRTICEMVCSEYPFMNLCTKAQLQKLI